MLRAPIFRGGIFLFPDHRKAGAGIRAHGAFGAAGLSCPFTQGKYRRSGLRHTGGGHRLRSVLFYADAQTAAGMTLGRRKPKRPGDVFKAVQAPFDANRLPLRPRQGHFFPLAVRLLRSKQFFCLAFSKKS